MVANRCVTSAVRAPIRAAAAAASQPAWPPPITMTSKEAMAFIRKACNPGAGLGTRFRCESRDRCACESNLRPVFHVKHIGLGSFCQKGKMNFDSLPNAEIAKNHLEHILDV